MSSVFSSTRTFGPLRNFVGKVSLGSSITDRAEEPPESRRSGRHSMYLVQTAGRVRRLNDHSGVGQRRHELVPLREVGAKDPAPFSGNGDGRRCSRNRSSPGDTHSLPGTRHPSGVPITATVRPPARSRTLMRSPVYAGRETGHDYYPGSPQLASQPARPGGAFGGDVSYRFKRSQHIDDERGLEHRRRRAWDLHRSCPRIPATSAARAGSAVFDEPPRRASRGLRPR